MGAKELNLCLLHSRSSPREYDNRDLEMARCLTVKLLPVFTACEEKKEALSVVGLI